nr:MAG: hypothetical protein [Betatorquevirus sp.]
MFNDYKPKNRRMTPKEFEEELWQASIFKRPPRTMLHDTPFYPWLPVTPLANQPFVNFKLNYTE